MILLKIILLVLWAIGTFNAVHILVWQAFNDTRYNNSATRDRPYGEMMEDVLRWSQMASVLFGSSFLLIGFTEVILKVFL